MRFEFVAAQKAHYPVSELCNALEVSTSGYYAWCQREKSQRQVEDEVWLKLIASIFKASRETYGSPRIHATLKEQGHKIGKKRVARIMQENGIVVRPESAWRASRPRLIHVMLWRPMSWIVISLQPP